MFETEVLNCNLPVLVDFYATWCGPCKSLAPTLEKIEEQYAGRLKVIKIDVDQEPALASSYEVRSVPTLLFFKDGFVASALVGTASAKKIKEQIEYLLE